MRRIIWGLAGYVICMGHAAAQQTNTECEYYNQVQEVVTGTEQLAAVWKDCKATVSVDRWQQFKKEAGIEGMKSFSLLGESGEAVKQKFIAAARNLSSKMEALYVVVKKNARPDEKLEFIIDRAFDCFFNNPVLAREASKIGVGVGGTAGPCEDALSICAVSAKKEYNRDVRNCILAAAGIGIAGMWWGLGAGVLCSVSAFEDFVDAINLCTVSYGICVRNN